MARKKAEVVKAKGPYAPQWSQLVLLLAEVHMYHHKDSCEVCKRLISEAREAPEK